MSSLADWCRERGITEVECMIPDLAGIPRGKILPTQKFLAGVNVDGHRLPESIFVQSVTGEYPETDDVVDIIDKDIVMRADENTIRMVPWYKEPTAQIICDCNYPDGTAVDIYTRQVLRKVLEAYDARDLLPIVSPELEFYLVKTNEDPDLPLEPPVGRNHRQETARQSYGIDAVNEFDPLFEDIYDYCEAQGLEVDTLNHEAGAAQMEINFLHGDALSLADQVFLFKRTVRQTAIAHGIYATFMAKPMQHEPGSSMHLHQSLVNKASGENMFETLDGADTTLFHNYIAGVQKYAPEIMALYAPNVNSYRRLAGPEAPVNTHWGRDNRSCGLRVPLSQPGARRLENRLPGADVNPYLTFAASLLSGLLGIEENLSPTEPQVGGAYDLPNQLPEHLADAIARFHDCKPLRGVLGDRFVDAYCAVKEVEYKNYQTVISSWEREHLLLNV